MAEMEHKQTHSIDGDHPVVLCGGDNDVTPVEMLLAALSGCITAGIGNLASIRQTRLESVETTVESDIDLNGTLRLDKSVRNGFAGIAATFRIKGGAPSLTRCARRFPPAGVLHTHAGPVH